MPHIAIIGLGQIGGSLGMALRQAKVGYDVIGHDREPEIAGKARKLGAVDRTEWNLPAAVRDAGLVIVAVPLDAVHEVLGQIAPHLADGSVVTDTASVKVSVLAWASASLPPNVSFVGGHPITRTEAPGIENATAGLFSGCQYCLMPALTASSEAITLVGDLAEAVGARRFFIDAAEHDSFMAALDHLPVLAATTLLETVRSDPAWSGLVGLGGPAFADGTKAIVAEAATLRAISEANREALLRWLDAYAVQLKRLRAAIAGEGNDDAALEAHFRHAQQARDEWLRNGKPEVQPPKAGERLLKMFLGTRRQRK